VSAKDRAFSRLSREELQDAIDGNSKFAKTWVRRREQKWTYLEGSLDKALISEAQDALFQLTRKVDFNTQQDVVKVLWDLVDVLGVYYDQVKRPQNVEVAAAAIAKELNQGLDYLVVARVWTRRAIE
jgi:hypothetical protein